MYCSIQLLDAPVGSPVGELQVKLELIGASARVQVRSGLDFPGGPEAASLSRVILKFRKCDGVRLRFRFENMQRMYVYVY